MTLLAPAAPAGDGLGDRVSGASPKPAAPGSTSENPSATPAGAAGSAAIARRVSYRVRRTAVLPGLAAAGLGGRPWQVGLFQQPELGRRLRELAPEHDLVVLQLARLGGHLGDLGDTPFVVDLIDSLALNFARRAAYDRLLAAPLWSWESRRLLVWERRLVERSVAGLLVSERDRIWLAERWPAATAAKLRVVPLAVPLAVPHGAHGEVDGEMPAEVHGEVHGEERGEVHGGMRGEERGEVSGPPARAAQEVAGRPGPLGRTAGELRRPDAAAARPSAPRLVITGNLGYFVNADAVAWWVRDVWPAVRAAWPGAELVVAGARPAARVRRAARAPGARLIASPPDLGAVLAGADVALAPTRAGSGVPVKVLEAWAAGVPVVASRWAASGVAGRPGRDLLVAESAGEWSEAIGRLLGDPALVSRLTAAGRARLEREHSPAAVHAALAAALGAVAG